MLTGPAELNTDNVSQCICNFSRFESLLSEEGHQARDMMAKLAVQYVGQVPVEYVVELCLHLYLNNFKGQQSNSYLRVIKMCQNYTQFDTNECQRKSK